MKLVDLAWLFACDQHKPNVGSAHPTHTHEQSALYLMAVMSSRMASDMTRRLGALRGTLYFALPRLREVALPQARELETAKCSAMLWREVKARLTLHTSMRLLS